MVILNSGITNSCYCLPKKQDYKTIHRRSSPEPTYTTSYSVQNSAYHDSTPKTITGRIVKGTDGDMVLKIFECELNGKRIDHHIN